MTTPNTSTDNSATDAKNRFGSRHAAEKYNQALVGTRKHQREGAALEKVLDHIKPGSTVLDFPCGTGRLYPQLSRRQFKITGADSSWHMADIARTNIGEDSVQFGVSDVLNTAFADNSFDAVICNRLFHHFFEPEIRQTALSELWRITRNVLIVSYYSDRCLDAYTFRMKNFLRGRSPTDRVPVPPEVFADDARAAGLKIIEEVQARPLVSMQTYAVLHAADR